VVSGSSKRVGLYTRWLSGVEEMA